MQTTRRCLHSNPSYLQVSTNKSYVFKRASFCTLKHRASITIEAALAVPLFLFAILALVYMIEVMSIRTSIRCGMQSAAKEAAEKTYLISVVSTGELQSNLIEAVGPERLDRSIVVGGSGGVDCSGSKMSLVTGILNMKIQYEVKLPLPVFAVPPVKMEETLRMKGWTGYAGNGFGDNDENETVYITESGAVYHSDYHCNYLELSIQAVSASSVSGLRNQSEGKYHACESCGGHGNSGTVYITDYGDRYHTSLSCSGLKRTIYAVPKSEAVGKGACKKCCK